MSFVVNIDDHIKDTQKKGSHQFVFDYKLALKTHVAVARRRVSPKRDGASGTREHPYNLTALRRSPIPGNGSLYCLLYASS